jgi:long-chain fatty acid transport protein
MKRSLNLVLAVVCCIAAAVSFVGTALATNGMNLEGYGPVATGMGGASMAYDNGTAAMMNNPATLGLMMMGDRLDVALGYLGPHITTTCTAGPCIGQSSTSSANAFYMPAIGYIRKIGATTFGVGMFSQGGMGTEYGADSFLAAGSGDKVRSELGVGRVLFPIAYNVNKDFTVGGTLDFVWASLDLKMALSGQQFFNMAGMDPTPGAVQQQYGAVSGSMLTTFGSMMPILDPADPVRWGRFDFSDDSAFTGKAKGTGYAAKIGGVYRINDQVSVGGTYHSKTALSDLEANGATVSFNVNADHGFITTGTPDGTFQAVTIPLHGKIKIKDFQWPQMVGVGVAYQATSDLMLVFDYKWINWKDVMKNFKMTFVADSNQGGMASAFDNTELDATLFQKWKDQHVFMIGAGYKVSPEWVLRAGLNIANNPIPDTYLNALFPATEKTHITIGTGYQITTASSVNFSFAYAPEVKSTSPAGFSVKHYQTNAQLMYSYKF